ncbi:MAG: ABC transporter ATP-binding protein [Nitrososphaerales archaeon]
MVKNLAVVADVTKWFPIRRSIIDYLLGRPRKYVKAVDGVSFDIKENEILALVGESGCGKTTIGKLVLGSIFPDSGTISFDGIPMSEDGIELVRRQAQIILQDPYSSINPRFKVSEIVAEPLIVHKVITDGGQQVQRIESALDEVKLTPVSDFLGRFPHMLSGGQKQRVAIARALVLRPKLIVSDEPVSMLDLSIRAEILELMLSLGKKFGIAYLYITHDLSTARYIADRIAVMYLGKIVETGKTDEVLQQSLHPYTKALIEAVPRPDPKNRFRDIELGVKGDIPSSMNIPSGCRFHTRCPYATKICEEEEPPLVDELRRGHDVACHHAKKIMGA